VTDIINGGASNNPVVATGCKELNIGIAKTMQNY
jgi:hypothetical protein